MRRCSKARVRQPILSTAQFQLVYYGTPEGERSMSAAHMAFILSGMSSLVYGANGAVYGQRTSANLSIRSIRSGSIEIQFVIELALNIRMQSAIDVTLNADDLRNVLFGGAGGVGVVGLFEMFKKFGARRRSAKVTDHDGRVVRVEMGEDATFLGYRAATELYDDPKIRRAVQHIVRPITELHLDGLIIRDGNEVLEKITRDEAYEFVTAEMKRRELDLVDAIRDELRTGFEKTNKRIEQDIGTWALLAKMMTQMQDSLDEIKSRLQ